MVLRGLERLSPMVYSRTEPRASSPGNEPRCTHSTVRPGERVGTMVYPGCTGCVQGWYIPGGIQGDIVGYNPGRYHPMYTSYHTRVGTTLGTPPPKVPGHLCADRSLPKVPGHLCADMPLRTQRMEETSAQTCLSGP